MAQEPTQQKRIGVVALTSLLRAPWLRGLSLSVGVLVSLLLHVVFLGSLIFFNVAKTHPRKSQPIKIHITEAKPKPKPEPVKPADDESPDKRIIEAAQQKTEKPVESRFLGEQDHKTEKETRVKIVERPKAADPGLAGKQKDNTKAAPIAKAVQPQPEKVEIVPNPDNVEKIVSEVDRRIAETKIGPGPKPAEPRKKGSGYAAMLPDARDLRDQVRAGYQDFVDEDVDFGDRIDLNTSEYRYIGYFTQMRKAIELVWIYPTSAARRGMQGEVGLQFAIDRGGHTDGIRVVRSSGYKVLDDAIIDAIRLASPFAPLPPSFPQKKLTVTGAFRYQLVGGMAH